MKSKIAAVLSVLLMISAVGCGNGSQDKNVPSDNSVVSAENELVRAKDITDGLSYDETNNTWANKNTDLEKLVGIMKREVGK